MDIKAIQKALDAQGRESKPYFGKRTVSASIVGTDCDAEIALKFRSFPQKDVPPQTRRIFELGHAVEPMVIAHLKGAGVPVIPFADARGYKQFTWLSYHGHAKVKVDGIIDWEDRPKEILEAKSAKESSFNGMKAMGIKEANPKYYAQAQMAMGLSGIRSVLMVVYCKDNSAYHAERIEFDEEAWALIKLKIERVLDGSARKLTKSEKDFRCMFCDVAGACWRSERPAERHCHHCAFAYPDVDQKWWCLKHERFAEAVCEDFAYYEPLPQ